MIETTTERLHTVPTDTDPVRTVISPGSAISWRGIFAGTLVGLLTYFLLSALGLALGAIALEQAIESGSGGTALGIGTSIWLVLSGLISLFVGGFVAARASGVIPTRIGGIEGLVVASLFFLLMLTGFGAGMGMLGRGIGALAGGTVDLAQDPQVQSVVEQSLQGLQLRSEPSVVIQNVGTRLIAGDEEGAATYLGQQAGISRQEAQQRLDEIKDQVATTAGEVGQTAAQATQAAGWILFGMILLGSAAALLGGALGARRNISHPLSDRDRKIAIESRGAWSLAPRRETIVRTDEMAAGPS